MRIGLGCVLAAALALTAGEARAAGAVYLVLPVSGEPGPFGYVYEQSAILANPRACEVELERRRAALRSDKGPPVIVQYDPDDTLPFLVFRARVLASRHLAAAKCVASDDPRLVTLVAPARVYLMTPRGRDSRNTDGPITSEWLALRVYQEESGCDLDREKTLHYAKRARDRASVQPQRDSPPSSGKTPEELAGEMMREIEQDPALRAGLQFALFKSSKCAAVPVHLEGQLRRPSN